MKNRANKIALLAGLMLCAGAAQAQDDIIVTKSGIGSGFKPYVGLGIGNASYDKAGNDDMSLGLFGGLNLNEVLAVELSWNNFGDGGNSSAKSEASAIGAAIVGNLPLGSEVTGFAQLGLSRWNIDAGSVDDSGTDVFYGIGIDYTVGGNSAVRFVYNVYPMDAEFSGVSVSEQVDVFSVGFLYRM